MSNSVAGSISMQGGIKEEFREKGEVQGFNEVLNFCTLPFEQSELNSRGLTYVLRPYPPECPR